MRMNWLVQSIQRAICAGALPALAVALAAAAALPAKAAVEISAAGSVAVSVRDELGNAVMGFSVQLRLPSADGELNKDADVGVTKTDGADDDDLAVMTAGGSAAIADGDVEFALSSLHGEIQDGQTFEARVSAPGLAEIRKTAVWNAGGQNAFSLTANHLLKIIVIDRSKRPVSGFSVGLGKAFQSGDGLFGDADHASNGLFYLGKDLLNGKNEIGLDLTVAVGGETQTQSCTINKKSQNTVVMRFEGDASE